MEGALAEDAPVVEALGSWNSRALMGRSRSSPSSMLYEVSSVSMPSVKP